MQFNRLSRIHGGVDSQSHAARSSIASGSLRRRRSSDGRATLHDAGGRQLAANLGGRTVEAADAAANVLVERAEAEAVDDGVAEASVHGAVHDEVDGAVDEHQDVPDVTERCVNVIEQVLVEAAQQRQHALRQLG